VFNKSLRKFAAQLQHYSDRFPQLASDNCDETDSSSIHNSPLSQFPQENHTNLRNLRQHSQLTTHNSLLPNCASNLALDSFLLNHFHLEGARALRFLIQHPNEDFTAQALVQILSGTIGYEKYIPFDHMQQTPEDRDVLQETPLIMTDEATLDQVRKRMEQIDLQKAQLKNRQPDCAELDAELKQLKKYLLECSRANGQLRSFNKVSRRPYQALCRNINRLRKILREQHPELDDYVEQHLQTSPYFRWISTGGH
jgi:hypothetical protein